MGDLIELIAVILGLSIPLSVIFGIFHLKSKKLNLRQFSSEERQVLLELKSENGELKRRLEQLETQAGISDHDLFKLEEANEPDIATKLAELAKKQKMR